MTVVGVLRTLKPEEEVLNLNRVKTERALAMYRPMKSLKTEAWKRIKWIIMGRNIRWSRKRT